MKLKRIGVRQYIIVKISICLLLASRFSTTQTQSGYIKSGHGNQFVSTSTLGKFSQFAISSDAPGCAASGKRMFLLNGSTIDAAIATLLCTGLVNIHSMGIGGGFIMVYYKASENKTYVLDSRETAPAAASEHMFVNLSKSAKTIGPLAIAIPSELKGFYTAWQKFGKLPWKTLFEDAITMAEEGVIVSATLGKMIQIHGPVQPEGSGLWKLLYNKAAGRYAQIGERIFRPKLAAYLRRVVANPKDILSGKLDVAVAEDLRDAGAIITLKDLVSYQPEWRQPIKMAIRSGPTRSNDEETELELHAAPPPSSGVLVGLALNMLAKHSCSNSSTLSNDDGYFYYQRLLETFKAVFAKRTYLADEMFLNTNGSQLLQKLQTLSFADQLERQISDDHAVPPESYDSVFTSPNDQGTSHISIVGPNRDGLAVTSTINTWFGSTVVGERTGILFNNEMDDFSSPQSSDTYHLPSAPANFIRPGKRPLSSMSPLIFTYKGNKTIRLVIGGSGGSQIITAVIMSASRNLQCKMNIKEAIDTSRVHHQLLPNYFIYESNLPKDILQSLKRRGHKIGPKRPASSVQGIEIVTYPCSTGNGQSNDHCLYANADYRKGGDTAGL